MSRGSPTEPLTRWLGAVEARFLRAMLKVDRVRRRQVRVTEAFSDLSGRKLPRLIAALTNHAVVSADIVASETGTAKAEMRRNLAEFERCRLVRGVTGQARLRVWVVVG